eukprot:10958783-Alexandrium_andersonii.AAC.1
MQNRFRRSNLELRGPRSGLKICPRSSRGVRSAQLCMEIPNPPPERVIEGVGSREIRGARGSNPQSANPQYAQSFALDAREPSF